MASLTVLLLLTTRTPSGRDRVLGGDVLRQVLAAGGRLSGIVHASCDRPAALVLLPSSSP